MRYFFLAYALIALLVVGMFGLRGQKFARPPLRVFPDMDEQDKLRAQRPDGFFADGHGARQPVAGTQPRGFNPNGAGAMGRIPEYEFGGLGAYYDSGRIGDYYGTGMPVELELTPDRAQALIRRGRERFTIHCAVCHGASGDGQGITSAYGVPVASNPNAKLNALSPEIYPDGRVFNTITRGMGRMSAYGDSIPVRDRWAIITYVHTLQAAKSARAQSR
jgi:mono/diheme cytochrome c family protein